MKINPLIIAETCGAIRRRAGREAAEKAIMVIRTWMDKSVIDLLPQTDETINTAIALCMDYGLKGADAVIAASAKINRCHLATFDEELRQKLQKTISIY